jgi:hypothetical protein
VTLSDDGCLFACELKFNLDCLPGVACFVKELNTRSFQERLLHIQKKQFTQSSDRNLQSLPRFPSKHSTFATTGPKKKENPGILIRSFTFTRTRAKIIRTSPEQKTKMATTFKQVDLFGGAITADFPAAFGDVR